MTTPATWKIDLENFAGPMDLLLYLIRKEEVDIHDIPIERILGQYMQYLEAIKAVNLDDAGEFLVMASTLMVIKSKMLLPVEEVDLDEELDPRYELVQQLLEYKRLKSGAATLRHRGAVQARRVNRPDSARPEERVIEDRSLDELQIWDLFSYFNKVVSETTVRVRKDFEFRGKHLPVREYARGLEERLSSGPVFLSELLEPEKPRTELVGYFLAILLLVKTQVVTAMQSGRFGDIRLVAKAHDAEASDQALELEDDFRD